MALYSYRAIDADGCVQAGELEASDRDTVIERLRAGGLLPVSAAEAETKSSGSHALPMSRRPRISQKHLALFARKLATVVQAGLDLDKALEIAGDLGKGRELRRLVERVVADLRGGKSLSDALAAHERLLPRYFIPMVRAGEASGSLGQVFARIAGIMEESERVRQSVRSALAYPIILLVTALGSVILLMAVVLPRFEAMFRDAGQKLPTITRVFMSASELTIDFGPIAAFSGLMTVVLMHRGRRDHAFRLRTDRLVLAIPVIGEAVLRTEIALFARTLGMLVQNGVPLLSGLTIAGASLANTALSTALAEARTAVKNGSTLAAALRQAGYFPPLAVQLIAAGEASGRLADMMIETGAVYDEEVRSFTQRAITLLTPIITLGLSLLVVAIIGSVLVAVLSVNDLVF
jgi:general secretion pathway protein F